MIPTGRVRSHEPHNSASRRQGEGRGSDSAHPRLATLTDLRVLAKLLPSLAIAWSLPESRWDQAAELAVGSARLLAPRAHADMRRVIERRLAGRIDAERADTVASALLRNLRTEQLCFLRNHWERGWCPRTRLEGGEHLAAAHRAGRGAVLWVVPTIFSWLFAKRALAEAGFAVHHLSREGHGFGSKSRLGETILNPIRTRIEDRYLAERITIPEGAGPQAALKRLGRQLAANGLVSITMAVEGARLLEARLLNGGLRAASGAPRLADRTGAALLPLVTLREEPGRYVARIGAPLPSASPQDALHRMACFLEPLAAMHPDQFCWHIRVFVD